MKKAVWDKGHEKEHQETVKTLFKVFENLILKPDDVKVRSLPLANKSV
jgi:hypothetical protein